MSPLHLTYTEMLALTNTCSYISIHTLTVYPKTNTNTNLMPPKYKMQSCTLHTGFIREAPCRVPTVMGGTWAKVPPKHTNYLDRTRPAEGNCREKWEEECLQWKHAHIIADETLGSGEQCRQRWKIGLGRLWGWGVGWQKDEQGE